jgi:hypothetical protein
VSRFRLERSAELFLFYFCNWPRVSRRVQFAPVDKLTGHRPLLARKGVVAITTNTQPGSNETCVVRRDHWSTICRPIIGKVQTKISNVSPQIIKHIQCMIRGLTGKIQLFITNPRSNFGILQRYDTISA